MISVVIPAYNEEARVAASVAAARSLPDVAEVLVADDGSTDTTAMRAEQAGATVLRLTHAGKGQAVAAAVQRARGSVVLLADADLGETIASFAPLLEPVARGQCQMTIAVFGHTTPGGGGMGAVLRLARWGVARLAGIRLAAPLSGQRAMPLNVLRTTVLEPGFGLEVGLDVDVLRSGGQVREIVLPVAAGHAVTGRTVAGFLHRGRQFVAVVRALWRRRRGGRAA